MEEKDSIYIDTGLDASDEVAFEAIDSVFGQVSDGKWENSPRMEGYWRFADLQKKDGRIVLKVDTRSGESEKRPNWNYNPFQKSWSSTYQQSVTEFRKNPYFQKSAAEILAKIADLLKAVVKDEYDRPGQWSRTNTAECDYLSGHQTVRVCDAYRVYDTLKGRKPKVYAASQRKMIAKELLKIAKSLVAKTTYYYCCPKQSYPRTEGSKKFEESIYAGECYDTMADARMHKKMFEEMFGIEFIIEKETE